MGKAHTHMDACWGQAPFLSESLSPTCFMGRSGRERCQMEIMQKYTLINKGRPRLNNEGIGVGEVPSPGRGSLQSEPCQPNKYTQTKMTYYIPCMHACMMHAAHMVGKGPGIQNKKSGHRGKEKGVGATHMPAHWEVGNTLFCHYLGQEQSKQ